MFGGEPVNLMGLQFFSPSEETNPKRIIILFGSHFVFPLFLISEQTGISF